MDGDAAPNGGGGERPPMDGDAAGEPKGELAPALRDESDVVRIMTGGNFVGDLDNDGEVGDESALGPGEYGIPGRDRDADGPNAGEVTREPGKGDGRKPGDIERRAGDGVDCW